jgi:hypothetical protein
MMFACQGNSIEKALMKNETSAIDGVSLLPEKDVNIVHARTNSDSWTKINERCLSEYCMGFEICLEHGGHGILKDLWQSLNPGQLLSHHVLVAGGMPMHPNNIASEISFIRNDGLRANLQTPPPTEVKITRGTLTDLSIGHVVPFPAPGAGGDAHIPKPADGRFSASYNAIPQQINFYPRIPLI